MKRFIAIALVLAACSGGSKTETAESQPVEQTEPAANESETETPPIGENMLSHWVYVTKIRDAVVLGDLTFAIREARTARGDESPVTGEELQPYVADMDLNMSGVFESESLAEAAMATAKLGSTCGTCHVAAGAQVELSTPDVPPEGDDPRAHMQQHQWAINAMWEGLVVPNDGRWQDGARLFTSLPMHRTDKPSEYVGTDVVKELGEKIHSLGTQANGVTDVNERAKLFGELIATCGDCHAQTQTGP